MADNKRNDMVQQPEHYQRGTYEVIDEMLLIFGAQRTFDFCILNAWKYRARAPYKCDSEEDMQKSSRYLEMAKQIADNHVIDGWQPVRFIKGGANDGPGR